MRRENIKVLRRCCLPGGVDRSEGVRNTTIHYTRIEKAKEDEKERLGLEGEIGFSKWWQHLGRGLPEILLG